MFAKHCCQNIFYWITELIKLFQVRCQTLLSGKIFVVFQGRKSWQVSICVVSGELLRLEKKTLSHSFLHATFFTLKRKSLRNMSKVILERKTVIVKLDRVRANMYLVNRKQSALSTLKSAASSRSGGPAVF